MRNCDIHAQDLEWQEFPNLDRYWVFWKLRSNKLHGAAIRKVERMAEPLQLVFNAVGTPINGYSEETR